MLNSSPKKRSHDSNDDADPATNSSQSEKKLKIEQRSETDNQNEIVGSDAKDVDQAVDDFTFSKDPSLETIRRQMSQFVKERNWEQFHTPRNLLLAMVGEVGEVAELFQWRGEVPAGLSDWSAEDRTKIEHELSDVFLYLIRLAEKCSVDLPKVALEKMALNAKKYPKDKVYGSSKKYNEYKEYARREKNN